MKKSVFKKLGVAFVSAAMLMTTACNTKIDAKFDFKALDYVTLGEYKGLKADVNTSAIETNLMDKKIANDQKEYTTYHDVTRPAQDGDKLIMTYYAKVGGVQVDGFSYEDYNMILGTDPFTIEGFTDALYGMTAGQAKVVTLQVPEDFEEDKDIAGSRIVFDITLKNVQQPDVPMITDAYVQQYFNCSTVADYKAQVKSQVQEEIDNQTTKAKNEAILTQLQGAATINSYPDGLLESKSEELSKSISFYSTMQKLTVEEYCQTKFNMSFDDYVKNSVNQQLILQAIVEKEELAIMEYDYKANLESFANELGYTNKTTFEEKFGKDKIVKNMLIMQAQDIVMDNADINEY
ncbi:MAG: FKBP-type peptidyl-prolyl cis-trans isomerase [Eubacteriales bacterium]|nr:FKBP-type peptidyl-prolyl cis-trans isomerase [Eubacteriales bacterium]